MTRTVTDIFLRFPDAASALVAAKALGFAGEEATELPCTGQWIVNGEVVADYAIDVIFGTGVVMRGTGTFQEIEGQQVEIMEQVPGFHINGRWVGDPAYIPDFGDALILPTNPACRFAGEPE